MAIRVLSFDFDGCLFHEEYIKSGSEDVVAHNEHFLRHIRTENGQFDTIITFVGSNRQSKTIDDANSLWGKWGKKSCFPAVIEISTALSARLDRFLLADVYGDLENGESFNRAIQPNNGAVTHKDWKFDATKVTILYAQMHKIATENPTTAIVFDFYDDRVFDTGGKRDILEWLKIFYKKNHELIPTNVTLRIHHYAGASVTLVSEIKGAGISDKNYRKTVKEMAEQTIQAGGVDNEGRYFIAHHVKPNNLQSRRPLTHINAADLRLFRMQLQKIEAKSQQLASRKHISASQKLLAIHASMNNALNSYLRERDYIKFKTACLSAIHLAHQDGELDQHRGWKECLVNFIASLSLIGIVAKGVINYSQNRSFFFVAQTASAALVDETKKMVDEMAPKA